MTLTFELQSPGQKLLLYLTTIQSVDRVLNTWDKTWRPALMNNVALSTPTGLLKVLQNVKGEIDTSLGNGLKELYLNTAGISFACH